MEIKAYIWDKIISINGQSAVFLKEHFKKQNGNDDRVLISYNGVISRIEYLDDCFFTTEEKEMINHLVMEGTCSREEAIVRAWQERAINEHNIGESEITNIERLRADVDYILIMEGLIDA